MSMNERTQATRVHGSEGGYVRGCRCDECRRASQEARARRRRGEGPGSIVGQQGHGHWAYRHHGCRCDVCRAANAKAQREWYARKRARTAADALSAAPSLSGVSEEGQG